MAFFEKKFCELCNDKVNLLTRLKLSEGFLCSTCGKKLSGFSSGWAQRSVVDVQQHLAQREQNKITYSQFQRNTAAGPNSELVVDSVHRLFYFAYGRDYRDGNPEVFRFDQLIDFYISEDYDAFTKDSDGDGISDRKDTIDNRTGARNVQAMGNRMANVNPMHLPPQIQQYIRRENNAFTTDGIMKDVTGLNLHFTVNHPYIRDVKIDVSVTDGNLMNRYQSCYQVMQLCEQIKGNAMMGTGMGTGMGQMGYAQPGMVMGMQPGMQGYPQGVPMNMQSGMQGYPQGLAMNLQSGMQSYPQAAAMNMQPGMQGYPQSGMMGTASTMACPFCGNPAPAGSGFCPACGGRLQ